MERQRRSNWRIGSVVGEGFRTALHGRVTTALLLMFVGGGSAIIGAADAQTVHEILMDESHFVEAGGRILVAEVQDGVSSQACDALNRTGWVRGSVALRRSPEFYSLKRWPGAQVSVVTATAGIGRLLPEVTWSGIEATPTQHLHERIGTAPDESFEFATEEASLPGSDPSELGRIPTGPLTLTEPADLDIFGDVYNTGLLIPASPMGSADTCYVWAEPQFIRSLRLSLPALLGNNRGEAIVKDRLLQSEFTVDFGDRYRTRDYRNVWLYGGAVLGVVWLLITWVRRSQNALYASLGMSRSELALLRVAEWLAIAVSGTLWAIVLGVLIAMSGGVPTNLALGFVIRQSVALLSFASALVVAVSLLYRPPALLTALKDR